MTHTVFVYGTLKSGFSNHHYLNGSDYLGAGKTVEKHAMYESGIPYVIADDPVSYIFGEVYSVDGLTLERLDNLEGHPDWYERKKVEVLLDNDATILSWLYFYPQKSGKLVKNGRYTKI
jgi:gamma-glutamylaminecyclotransferase